MDLSIQSNVAIREGLEVYAADGSKVGKVSEVHAPAYDDDSSPDFPEGTRGPVFASTDAYIGNVDLDITGSTGPLTAGQPSQGQVGGEPEPRNLQEDVERVDVGTDYKALGEAGAPTTSHPAPGGDPRDTEGYFKVSTGLLSTDLYLPLSAVESISGNRLTLNLTWKQVNDNAWEKHPSSGGGG